MPTVGAPETGGFRLGDCGCVKLTITVDDGGIVLLVDGEVVYFAAVAANVALDTRVFLKRDTGEYANAQITGTALCNF